jgi:hypothetical protein
MAAQGRQFRAGGPEGGLAIDRPARCAPIAAATPLPCLQAGQCGNQIGAKFWEASLSGGDQTAA